MATSSRQRAHPCFTSCAEFFVAISHHPGDSPLQPRFCSMHLLAFPQTKSTFEREKISDHQRDSGEYDRVADGNWENCVRSQGASFQGTEASLSYVPCFLYLISTSINVSIFHITWLDNFWTDLVIQHRDYYYTYLGLLGNGIL